MRTPEGDLRAYLEHLEARGLSSKTVTGRRHLLGHFLDWLRARGGLGLAEVTGTILESYLLEESRREGRGGGRALSPDTIGGKTYAIKGLFRYLAKTGAILNDPSSAISRRKHRRGGRRAPGREEIARLLSFPFAGPAGLRDLAIMEMLYSSGLRCAELCALDLGDVDHAGGLVRVRKGKGGKGRLVPAGETALNALRLYLEKGRPEMKPHGPALFVSRFGRRLPPNEVNVILRKRCRQAGLQVAIKPHELRHAFATHLLENGADIRHVQAMLGHASIKSTQIYTHVDIKRLGEEIGLRHPRSRLERGDFLL